jgi:putative acetyltransferase
MQLWGVYVDPDYRSLGLATRLAGAAIDYARTLPGVLQIHLTVWSNNHAAIASYTRLGFQRWGTMPRADIIDGEAIDYDHMVLMLDQSSTTKT